MLIHFHSVMFIVKTLFHINKEHNKKNPCEHADSNSGKAFLLMPRKLG